MCRVWDIARGKCERVMEGHTGRLNSVRLGPNNTALTVSDDYTARVWDLSTGTCQHVFKGALSSALPGTCLKALSASAWGRKCEVFVTLTDNIRRVQLALRRAHWSVLPGESLSCTVNRPLGCSNIIRPVHK